MLISFFEIKSKGQFDQLFDGFDQKCIGSDFHYAFINFLLKKKKLYGNSVKPQAQLTAKDKLCIAAYRQLSRVIASLTPEQKISFKNAMEKRYPQI